MTMEERKCSLIALKVEEHSNASVVTARLDSYTREMIVQGRKLVPTVAMVANLEEESM